jgi:hypothetical protein
MNATPRRRSRDKLFKAFYCFSGSEQENGVVRTVAKYKPPSSTANRPETTGQCNTSPPTCEPEQVQDTAVALLCLPDGLQRLHQLTDSDLSDCELFHTFVITQETGHRLFGSAIRVWDPIDCSEHPQPDTDPTSGTAQKPSRQCYQNKALCLLTALPLVIASKRILRHIWSHNCSIELIQLICSIPTPGQGRIVRVRLPQLSRRRSSSADRRSSDRSSVELAADQHELLMYGGISTLPSFDYPLRYLLTDLLPGDQFVRLFAAVLLEQRILITSSRHLPLMLVAESLTNLLRPFTWQHVYVPILPSRLGLHYLDAPTPYIMGIVQSQFRVDEPNDHDCPPSPSPISSAHWRFDCDRRKVHLQPQCPSELDVLLQSAQEASSERDHSIEMLDQNGLHNNDPRHLENQEPPLPPFLSELSVLLKRTLEEWQPSCDCMPPPTHFWNLLQADQTIVANGADSSIGSSPWSSAHLNSSSDCAHLLEEQRFNHVLRSAVYRHLQKHLLDQHERYIQLSRPDTVKFDAVSFLCDQPAADRPFLTRFVQTQMFASMLDESGRKLQAQLYQQNVQGAAATAAARDALFIVDTDELSNDGDLPPSDSNHVWQAFNEAKLLDLRTLAEAPAVNMAATGSTVSNGTPTHSNRLRYGLNGSLSNASPFKVCMSPIRIKSKSSRPEVASIQAPADAFAAQTHCRVIDSLLKEAKVKTKRIVMDCMRDEKRSPSGKRTQNAFEKKKVILSKVSLIRYHDRNQLQC